MRDVIAAAPRRGAAVAVALACSVGPASAQDRASGAPPAEPPPAAFVEPPRAADAPALGFRPQTGNLSLTKDSAAYVAPSFDAPQMYPLRSGTPIAAVAASEDGAWIVSMTEDGQAAFIPDADLGPYDPSRAPQPVPEALAGKAEVVDTGTLIVDGHKVALTGVLGVSGAYAAQLQTLIDAQGRTVRCEQQNDAYVCKLPDGVDIARAALYNGAASPGADASPDYRRQADAARASHRGIWK